MKKFRDYFLKSFKRKLTMLIVIAILLPMVISGIIVSYVSEQQIRVVFEDRLNTGINAFSMIISNKEAELSTGLMRLASDNTIQITLELAIYPQLDSYLKKQNKILNLSELAVLDIQKNKVASTNKKINLKSRTETYFSGLPGVKTSLEKKIPIIKDKKLIGYIFGKINLADAELVSHLKNRLFEDYYIAIDKNVVVSSLPVTLSHYQGSIKKLLPSVVSTLNVEGVDYLILSKSSQVVDYQLDYGVLIPLNQVYGARNMIFTAIAGVIISLFVLFSLILHWFIKDLTQPITALTLAASDMGNLKTSVFQLDFKRKDEIGKLNIAFRDMHITIQDHIDEIIRANKALSRSSNELKNYSENLAEMVEERTAALNQALNSAEQANNHILDSLNYAKRIQSSLLPSQEKIDHYIPDSFFIWHPRDIVGGDIYFVEYVDNGVIVGLFDCTGHGVPGAFMTMIAITGLKKIIRDEGRQDPSDILTRLNFIVKMALQQDTKSGTSDDGLDAAVCFLTKDKTRLDFAGANMPLVKCRAGKIKVFKGRRHSLGYLRSDPQYQFTTHHIDLKSDDTIYLYSDGVTDQFRDNSKRFGKKRLYELITTHNLKSMPEQKNIFLEAFNQFSGQTKLKDDLTFIGFKPYRD